MEDNYHYYKMIIFNRKFKITERKPPPDVTDAFTFCTDGDSQMSPDHFRRFLIEFQRQEHTTIDDAKRLMELVLHRFRPNFTLCSFTLDDFFKYLFLDDLNSPIPSQVHHDMTAPLQHYFIYTGHNSYLTGNQFNSDCSEVPIIKALRKGVRVIELDLWPNSAKDGIHVLHGWTMTTPVRLSKCLKSIREHAFVNSHYPVIITLEDHLTPNLRTKVAAMATEIFGDMLYCPKAGDSDEFPSPEELKHRIILSTKPPKECLDSNKLEEELIAEDETPCIGENANPSDETIGSSQEGNVSNLNQNLSEFLSIDSEDEDGDAANEKPGQKTPREYIQIIGIHAAKANKELRLALEVGSGKGKRISMNEQTLEKAAEDYGSDLVRFTQKNFVRVFPKGTRVTSTNFKPLLAWMHGAQMVASNMQGYGKSLWMMHGMFRSNGGCGYVKKPDFLMRSGPNNEVFNPKVTLPVKKTLKVTVYMGDGWHMDFSQTHFDT
ncbi:putative phosphoinositide phospholipase C [Helianthus anomalus]